ncbi:hypothetical protein KP79_PYT12873 [Mizuhopecten yessoensis]|uniref:Uncharacterized protein n=1 Tax=Mizuhopecten yessoensis TaxID=6573 RepID=A0A210QW46_MIZYE|nr:hypothetical protein KP79_PYT12873 [Mizuhopecten yessoensis]
MVLSREAIVGLIVVPIMLAISFTLLVTYHMTRQILCGILGCFWKKKKCLCCQQENCKKRQSDIDFNTPDHQPINIEDSVHPEKSTSSIEEKPSTATHNCNCDSCQV